MITEQTWTYNVVNDTLVIDSSFGLKKLSIVLISGTGTYSGDLQAGTKASQALALTIGTPITIGDPQVILSGITVTTTGTIQLIGS